jgi:D-tagatose-bisphosphate aldolase class II non-catalytic subunit
VTAIVVQPGVEFGVDRVTAYDPARARSLSEVLALQPGIVFEAHSTDYQSPDTLRTLVSDGFAILKVGPALTFALREALYGLDKIALELDSSWREHSLQAAMERLMVGDPVNWVSYYSGGPQQQRLLRHYSYSDRIRYYWPQLEAKSVVDRLMRQLGRIAIPPVLISQFLPRSYEEVRDGRLAAHPQALVEDAIRHALEPYRAAKATGPASRQPRRENRHES